MMIFQIFCSSLRLLSLFLYKMKLGTHCYLVPDCLLEPAYLLETAEYLYDKNQWYWGNFWSKTRSCTMQAFTDFWQRIYKLYSSLKKFQTQFEPFTLVLFQISVWKVWWITLQWCNFCTILEHDHLMCCIVELLWLKDHSGLQPIGNSDYIYSDVVEM